MAQELLAGVLRALSQLSRPELLASSRSVSFITRRAVGRRVLVVKLHAQRSVHRLRDFGNRGGRLVADLVGVDLRRRAA